MKLTDIMELVESSLKINETNLSKESLETGTIYGRILRIRSEENIRLGILKQQLKSLYFSKREYYSGKAEPEVYKEKPFNRRLLKTEVEEFVETDSEVKELISKIDVQSEKVSYLNDALKMISGRQFQIKNAIEYQKILNGGY